ncbi:MAG TPA: VWA domain-containing protein [Anaerolineaceae bacterium]|nr:VWA domain-containing protein [Anaerolineaceae bacterium]
MKKNFRILCLIFSVTFIFLFPLTVFAQISINHLQVISLDDSSFPNVKSYLSFSDSQGFPITGLDKNSFKLTEDGNPIGDYSIIPVQNTQQPLAIVVVMDVSGSMAGKPLKDSIEAAKSFVSALQTSDQVALISFSTKPQLIQDFTSDHDLFNVKLDSLIGVGDTAMNDAILDAVGLLETRGERKVVILLTDGRETGISKSTFDMVSSEATRRATPIYPIGFGDSDKIGLEKLAKATGGVAQVKPDSSSLKEAFKNVLDFLRNQYLLEFTSKLMADGKDHNLAIAADFEQSTTTIESSFNALPRPINIEVPGLTGRQEVSGKIELSPQISAPSSVQSVDILLDKQSLVSFTKEPFVYTWDTTIVPKGEHAVEIVVTDSVGNIGSRTYQFLIIPPVTISIGLTEGQHLGGKTQIPVTINAPAGIEKVEAFIDGQKIGEKKDLPFDFDWDTTTVVPGLRVIKLTATDLQGFKGETEMKVNVNMQKPNNLLWLALATLLVALGIILPISVRNQKRRKAIPTPLPIAIDEPKPQTAVLVELTGINPGYTWQLNKPQLSLGRKKDENDIPLAGASASRFQGLIRAENGVFLIQSLNSTNPITLNGDLVLGEEVLKSGDQILAGESEFTFQLED